MMRFLANENVPLASVRWLRDEGHDVVAIVEESPGAKDHDILARAATEQRILITFDRDYGELIYRLGLPAPSGVVYFRMEPAIPEEPAMLLLQVLNLSVLTLESKFTVVERDHIRQRPLVWQASQASQ